MRPLMTYDVRQAEGVAESEVVSDESSRPSSLDGS
jgi:hypothetical protein